MWWRLAYDCKCSALKRRKTLNHLLLDHDSKCFKVEKEQNQQTIEALSFKSGFSLTLETRKHIKPSRWLLENFFCTKQPNRKQIEWDKEKILRSSKEKLFLPFNEKLTRGTYGAFLFLMATNVTYHTHSPHTAGDERVERMNASMLSDKILCNLRQPKNEEQNNFVSSDFLYKKTLVQSRTGWKIASGEK